MPDYYQVFCDNLSGMTHCPALGGETLQECIDSIQNGKEAYTKWLKTVNKTTNKDVWKVYDHLATDIVHDLLGELMEKIDKDLDQYCEKVIYDEF